MSKKEKSIRHVLNAFEKGDLAKIDKLFYTYECDVSELTGRGVKLLNALQYLSRSPYLNIDELGVAFYNIEPLDSDGSTSKTREMYDGISLYHIDSDKDIFYITPGRKINGKTRYEVSGRGIDPLLICDTWEEVISFFYDADKFNYQ